jgi:hypothetical protein
MAMLHHTRRRSFDQARRNGRTSIDDMMRSTDVALHIVVIGLLIVFALGVWHFSGSATAPSSSTGAAESHPAQALPAKPAETR